MFSGIRRKLTKLVLTWALALALCCIGSRGAAQSAEELQHKAATLFDRGVAEFAASQYQAAARSFLAAADVVPSREALKNALAAAQRAQQPPLVAQTAARLLALPGLDGRSRREARRALQQAEPQSARVDVTCAPAPCRVRIDGEPTAPGSVYLSPGTHEFVAANTDGWQVAEPATCAAGAQCRVALELAPAVASAAPPSVPNEPAVAAPTAPTKPSETAAVMPTAPAEPANSGARVSDQGVSKPTRANAVDAEHEPRKVAALVSFAGAATATAAFVALVSWSGAQALAERREHQDNPAHYDEDELRRLARRTDYLLIGAVVSAGATAAIGLWWVDFGGRRRASLSLAPVRGITLVGQF